ncbi:MAG TPA: hypothetical protein VF765_34665 [Polyangiaceae bacterium]
MSTLQSWRSAFARGAQWRYLLVYVVGTLIPALVLCAPVHGFLEGLLNHSPRQGELVAQLDSAGFFEILRQLMSPEGPDLHAATHTMTLVALFLVGPGLAGAAAVVAERSTPLRLREILAGAGAYYPRMLRMLFVSILPLGIAIGLSAAILHFVHRAETHMVLETEAARDSLLAGIGVAVLVWLAMSTVEVGRAVLVAEPKRKSALLAWWRGVRFFARRFPSVFGLCALTTLVTLAIAAALTALRLRLNVTGPALIAMEFVVAQGAVAVLGWGRSSRIAGLVAMLRANP